MLLAVVLIMVIALTIAWFMGRPPFGKTPAGDRQTRIERSPNYRDGAFQNLSPTPALKEGVSYFTVFGKFFFGKSKRSKPDFILPSQKTDLHSLLPKTNCLVWFGHSSYFLQIDGKKFLIDPVFSGHASPVNFTTRSFKGSDVYTTDDMPDIDCLVITHDHWDHLDYNTAVNLLPKVRQVVTGLGVGAHLERWGYKPGVISELDWNESVKVSEGFMLHATPGRHFSGRTFKRNQTVWLSFVLDTPTKKFFLGGDSGYDFSF